MTDFQAAAGEYLALRRALGFKLIQAERILRSFTSYLHEQEHRRSRPGSPWNGRSCPARRPAGGGSSG